MAVTIHCPHCGAAGSAPDQIIGQTVRCSKCKQSFTAGGDAGGGELEELEPDPAPARRGGRRRDEDDDDDFDDAPKKKGRSIRREGGGFGDVLAFRKLIAPTLAVIVFWIYFAFAILGWLGYTVLMFMAGGAIAGIMMLFIGLIGVVIALMVLRISMEFVVIVFRIFDVLNEMKNQRPPT
jgi:hypothetical protein